MLNIGMTELLVFGIIALLVLGPDKLPEAVRFAGKWYGKLKRMISNVQNDIDRELRMSELREQMQSEMQRIQDLEKKMQAQMHVLQQQSHMTQSESEHTATVDHQQKAPIYQYIDQNADQTNQAKFCLRKQPSSANLQLPNQALSNQHLTLQPTSPLKVFKEAV